MLFPKIFDRYYNQISSSNLPEYKKYLGKIYIKDIQASLASLQLDENRVAVGKINDLQASFESRYHLTFKPLKLSEYWIRESIRSELEPEWSRFFKSISVLIDNHDFYQLIENRFKRYFSGIVKAGEVLAKDIKLIVAVQSLSSDALKLGAAKRKLVQNLQFLDLEIISDIFNRFYVKIEKLRDDIENYSPQTVQELQKAKETLSFQIEKLIYEEKSNQSEHEHFFLNYRLRISKEVDPVCDRLHIFNFRADNFRSEFIKALIGFENQRHEELGSIRQLLDRQINGLIQEISQMEVIEQANKKSRAMIDGLSKSSKFQFFQEVADESQQSTLRAISESIRDVDVKAFPIMLDRIEKLADSFRTKIQTLLETERKYLKLRQETIDSVKSIPKFSFSLLNLNSKRLEELFIPNSSYNLISEKIDSYDVEVNRVTLERTIVEETLLTIGDIGDLRNDPINISVEIELGRLLETLARKVTELEISETIGFIPVLIDERERTDIPQILFFCRQPEETRSEFIGLLEIRQQGKLLYSKKVVCILPLPAHLLNDILENYKVAFKTNVKKVSQLVSDEFLSHKLKIDLQGEMLPVMAQARKNLRNAYLADLKEDVLKTIANDGLSNNSFLKTVDSLIVDSLDSLVHGDEEKPITW
jgi:hypothetical protein